MVAIKIEFVSSKLQAFSSYSLICGENCVICRLSVTVCFLSGMIVLLMGNSLNCFEIMKFHFSLFKLSFYKKVCVFFGIFLAQARKYENKIKLERKI